MADTNNDTAPSREQLAIAFGKYLAGYRPGEDGWTALDQEALEYAYYGDSNTEVSFG